MSEKTPIPLEINNKNTQGSFIKTSLKPEELEDFDRRLKEEDKIRRTESKTNENGKRILVVGSVDKDGIHFKDKAA